MTRHFCKTLCLTGIVLLYCATNAQAQPAANEQPSNGYFKMICRGADSAFRIVDLERRFINVKLGLNFSPSTTAPRGDVWKIDPGTCSWDDRTVNDNEPKQIQFIASTPQAQKIRAVLNSPDQFWQFYVRLTNYGYFETRSNNHLRVRPQR